MKQVDNGYSLGSSTITKISHGENTLKKLTKEKGQAQKKKDRESGQELDIVKYTYKHDSGICYLYENNTTNKELEETVNFKVHTNLRIVGNEEGDDKVTIKIGPGEKAFI